MKILVWGNDARGYTLASRLKTEGNQVYCVGSRSAIHDIADQLTGSDLGDDVLKFALVAGIELVVFSGEKHLVAGWADRFREAGIYVYGPGVSGARLEGSKAFCKRFFRRHRIPTAPFRIFELAAAARVYVVQHGVPIVIKADGLAEGKGVFVCQSITEAFEAIDKVLGQNIFHHPKPRVVIEDCLIGRECSFIVATDGVSVVEMVPARDYKHRYEDNRGPMTGGMGAYAPDGSLSTAEMAIIRRKIVERTLKGLRQEGIEFRGTLYFGLMITKAGVFVLEINVRFGDPETQVTIPLLKSRLTDLLLAVSLGRLDGTEIEWFVDLKAVGVVLVSAGYPGEYEKGLEISGLRLPRRNVHLFLGGCRKEGRVKVVTTGGRVLTVVATAPNFSLARARAYSRAEKVQFIGKRYRTDIAAEV